MNLPKSVLIKKQEIKISRKFKGDKGEELKMVLNLRYDDCCGNGYNNFAITADVWSHVELIMAGSCHVEIAQVFPEFAKYIKWHSTGSTKPSWYLENTLYHVSDRDCNGLLKGELQQILKGGEIPCWVAAVKKGDGTYEELRETKDSHTKPESDGNIEYIPWCRVGEGKEIDLQAARRCAVWADAELEDFTEEKLLARLPDLMNEFKTDMESLGFVY